MRSAPASPHWSPIPGAESSRVFRGSAGLAIVELAGEQLAPPVRDTELRATVVLTGSASATSSLPGPDSPSTSTVASVDATRSSVANTLRMATLVPRMLPNDVLCDIGSGDTSSVSSNAISVAPRRGRAKTRPPREPRGVSRAPDQPAIWGRREAMKFVRPTSVMVPSSILPSTSS